jgi:hypothetical protein
VGEDELQVVEAEVGGEALVAEHVGDELGLLVLEDADLLFDGVAGEQAVGDDLVFLADAVGAVDGLVFDGGVPPRIVEDDVGGGGQVEAAPPALSESMKTEGSLVVWKRSISPLRSLVWPVR